MAGFCKSGFFGNFGRQTLVLLATVALVLGGFGGAAVAKKKKPKSAPTTAADLKLVDCLLPGQVRKRGRSQVFVSPRRPIQTTVINCEFRGGEYVSYDRAGCEQARQWWLTAAEGGDPEAAYYLGQMYDKGLCGDPDYDLAADWYRRAADEGHGPSQISLGFLYEKGLGVDHNPKQAMELYRLASGVSGVIVDPEEWDDIQHQLREVSEQLEVAEASRTELQDAVQTKQQELDGLRGSSEASEERISKLRAQIAGLNRDLESRGSEIARLETSRTQYVGQIPGPSIELIDTTERNVDPAKTLIGRIKAPAGLAVFLIDGKETSWDQDGFFEYPLRNGAPVRLAAVDRQGERVELVHSPRSSGGGAQPVPPVRPKPAKRSKNRERSYGQFHALVIGNAKYEEFEPLTAASVDAQAIAGVLETHYGFEITLLNDASRVEILMALETMNDELTDKDNLLIYYAGHGELDERTKTGYWLPVDAERQDRGEWISSQEIGGRLRRLPAKHVLVIADSCYSGALTLSSLPDYDLAEQKDRQKWIETALANPSRTALTSGGLNPVLDTGSEGHSVFAKALMDVLTSNDDVLEALRLSKAVRNRVEYQTKRGPMRTQIPEYAPIKHSGHAAGEFFFVPS